jgi:hypothetical protein
MPSPAPTRTPAPAQAPASRAATVPADWLDRLPTVEAVRAAAHGDDPADTAARQEAALAILQHFAITYGGMGGERYRDYDIELRGHDVWSANRYVRKPNFIRSAITTFIAPEAADDYARTRMYRGMATGPVDDDAIAPPPLAPAAAWVEADLAAAKGRTEMSILGFELGRHVKLPTCKDIGFRAALDPEHAGRMKGAPTSCMGDPQGELIRGWTFKGMAQDLMGQKPDGVAVTLADSKCPSWLRASGSCVMQVKLDDTVLVGVSISSGSDGDSIRKVPQELTRKYGPPDRKFEVTCTHQEKATATANGVFVEVPKGSTEFRGTGLTWSRLPGLYVTYVPYAYAGTTMFQDCYRGQLDIEMAGLHKAAVDAAAKAAASDPKL